MESTGEASKIHMSQQTQKLLSDEFAYEERGVITIKVNDFKSQFQRKMFE